MTIVKSDNELAIETDPHHPMFGWVFRPGFDPGQWVSVREATIAELGAAMRRGGQDEEPSYHAPLRAIAEQLRRRGNCGCTVVLADGVYASLSLDVPDPFGPDRRENRRTPTSEMTSEEITYARGLDKLHVDEHGLGSVPTTWLEEWRRRTAQRQSDSLSVSPAEKS